MKKRFLKIIALVSTCFMISMGFQASFATETPRYGGVFKRAENRSPRNFGDPLKIRGADKWTAAPALETLILEKKGTLEYIPLLATDWKMSPDGKTFDFSLRKGVKFHDGTEFNAEAVKFNLELWLKAPGPVLSTMTSVEVINNHKIRVKLSEYSASFLHDLAYTAFIASPTSYKKLGKRKIGTRPVGTGPFKFKKYERDVVINYVKNENYWKKGRPYLDGYDVVVIKDPMTAIAALKAGEVHAIQTQNRSAVAGLIESGYVLMKDDGPMMALYGDSIHPDSPWANKKVREAIEYAIDKESIMTELGLGFPKPLYQSVPADNPSYDPSLQPRKYNPARAKKLLAEAGYPNGFQTKISHNAVQWPDSWVAIQGYLAAVGIAAELNPVDRPKFVKLRFQGGLKNGGCLLVADAVADHFLAGLSGALSTAAKNGPDMLRPEGFDRLVKQAMGEVDKGKRDKMARQASKLLFDDVTFIPLNQEARLNVKSPVLRNWDPTVYTLRMQDTLVDAWLNK